MPQLKASLEAAFPVFGSARKRVDIDLSALPIGKHAEGAKKGYVAKKQNTYTRQLARLVCGETQEIFSNQLYPGDTRSDAVFKTMLGKLETVLTLDRVAKRSRVRLRFDAGFGTNARITWFPTHWEDVYLASGSRRVATVEEWVSVPTRKGSVGEKWVKQPHRFASRCENTEKRTWSYAVLVSTDINATLEELLLEYDQRSGAPENSFAQVKHSLYENIERQDLSHSKFCFTRRTRS